MYDVSDDRAQYASNNTKSGLMVCMYYLLVRAAKIIRVQYLLKDDSIKATATAEF